MTQKACRRGDNRPAMAALARAAPRPPVRPALIGVIEIVLSVAVLACAHSTGAPD